MGLTDAWSVEACRPHDRSVAESRLVAHHERRQRVRRCLTSALSWRNGASPMRTTATGHPVIHAAYEIDRLIAFHASIPELHHRLPFLRAARNRQLSMCELERGGAPEWRELERLTERLPLLLLIGDDDHQSTGPAGWPGLQRMRYWRPRMVIVHATGGDEAIAGHRRQHDPPPPPGIGRDLQRTCLWLDHRLGRSPEATQWGSHDPAPRWPASKATRGALIPL
jgi:hypothetical protein